MNIVEVEVQADGKRLFSEKCLEPKQNPQPTVLVVLGLVWTALWQFMNTL